MSILDSIIELDRAITLALNGSDSLFLDGVVNTYTSMVVWIPVALSLIFIVLRSNSKREVLFILLMLVLTVVATDQVSSSIFKPMFHRFRPTQDPEILNLVDTVNGYRGGQFGFISSHAANSFGIVTYFIWLFRNKWFSCSAILFAVLNCLTRTYLGVHFFGDILCGSVAGIIIGTVFYWILRACTFKNSESIKQFSSNIYTSSGYLVEDLTIFQVTLYGTYVFIILYTAIRQGIMPF